MTSDGEERHHSPAARPANEWGIASGDALLQFVTSTGSTYQVDLRQQQIRRLTGPRAPTPRQGEDGTWRHYLHITPIALAAPVIVVWRHTADGTAEATITSAVVHIEPIRP